MNNVDICIQFMIIVDNIEIIFDICGTNNIYRFIKFFNRMRYVYINIV